MALDPNLTSTSGLEDASAIWYDRKILDRLEKKLFFVEQGDKRVLPKQSGNQIQFLRPTNLAAITTNLTEGTNPDGQAYQSTKIVATPLQYGGYIAFSDRLDLEAYSDITARMMELVGYQAGLSLDTLCRNALHTNVTNRFASGVANEAAVSAVASATELRKVVKVLATNDAMEYGDGTFHGIIHPATSADLQADSAVGAWMEVNKYVSEGRNTILNGEVGKMNRTRFMESSNVDTGTGSGSVTTYRNFIFSEGAFGVVDVANSGVEKIVHQPGSSGVADPLNLNGSIGWKSYFVTKVLDANRAVELYVASNY